MRWCWRPARSRTSSARRERPSTRSRCTRSTTPPGCARGFSALFEEVDRDPSLVDRGALNIVVVGGGPTGVEVAGALGDMIKVTVPSEYRNLDRHQGPHPPARLRRRLAQAVLGQRPRVRRQGARGQGRRDPPRHRGQRRRDGARGVLRRNRPADPLRGLGRRHQGRRLAAEDCGLAQGRGGRVDVRPDLTLPGSPGVYFIGDIANIPGPGDQSLPQLGSVALQSGASAANNIIAGFEGKEPKELPLPRQGDHGDDRPRGGDRRGRQAPPRDPRRARAHGLARRPRQPDDRDARQDRRCSSTGRGTGITKTGGPHVLDRGDAAEIDWDDDPTVSVSESASRPPPTGRAASSTSRPPPVDLARLQFATTSVYVGGIPGRALELSPCGRARSMAATAAPRTASRLRRAGVRTELTRTSAMPFTAPARIRLRPFDAWTRLVRPVFSGRESTRLLSRRPRARCGPGK